MFKKLFLLICLFFINFLWFSFVFWNSLGSSNPQNILEDMKTTVQDTALNDVNWAWVESSLSSIKDNSNDYISWLWFIWLSIALILIIYNGIYLLANFTDENRFSKIKKRFVSLIIWVVVLTSGYLIIKFAVSIIWDIFK